MGLGSASARNRVTTPKFTRQAPQWATAGVSLKKTAPDKGAFLVSAFFMSAFLYSLPPLLSISLIHSFISRLPESTMRFCLNTECLYGNSPIRVNTSVFIIIVVRINMCILTIMVVRSNVARHNYMCMASRVVPESIRMVYCIAGISRQTRKLRMIYYGTGSWRTY